MPGSCKKSGVSPGAGVAAVGVNALMGAIAHLLLLVIFFTLAGHRMAQAFKLPPASKLLLILALAAALTGIVLATRRAGGSPRPGCCPACDLPPPACGPWRQAPSNWPCWPVAPR